MREAVRRKLLNINRAFYQTLAHSFAATRRRPQPGVERVLTRIEAAAAVLDLGCGHGLAAAGLTRQGHAGPYLGVDGSQALIDLARARPASFPATYVVDDLVEGRWTEQRRRVADDGFDWVLAFAVFHHIPDHDFRVRLARQIHDSLIPGGRAAVSVWDFRRRPRFASRLVPWERAGLRPADVEAGDALLDWRHQGSGLRYLHHFDSAALRTLAHAADFAVDDEFRSDGEGGELGLYQIWRS